VTWLSAIATAISLISALVQWLERRDIINAALSAAILQGLRESDEAIKRADDARQAVRDSIARNPDSVREPDEFERRD
jgi:hypothetical protein